MNFQFQNHDYTVKVPKEYENLFKTDEQRELLGNYLRNLPPFQDVPQGIPLLPSFDSSFSLLLNPKVHELSSFDLALMEMASIGLGMVTETTMLLYIMRKLKELELKIAPPVDPNSKNEGGFGFKL